MKRSPRTALPLPRALFALVSGLVALGGGASLAVVSACARSNPSSSVSVAAAAHAAPSAAPRDGAAARALEPRAAHNAGAPAESSATPARAAQAPVEPPEAAPATGGTTGFLGGADRATLRRVCDGAVTRIERNRGGSTISFRVWFADGSRGLFKPQQTNSIANFRAELAAYRLSRLLGLHRVPPACGRALPRAQLQRVADVSGDAAFSERVMRELLGRGDTVPGAMLHWVPGPLENVPDTQRWPELLSISHTLVDGELELAGDLARLLLFDFVIDNVDRWSGGNILRQRPANGPVSPMLFMDNGAAFTVGDGNLGARPRDQASRLARVQRLPRAMLTALRGLTAETLGAAMRDDPLGAALGPAQIAAVLARRDRVVAHADALVAQHGEATVYAFP